MQSRLQLALSHHQAGDLAKAEQLYRDVLGQEPAQPTALHYLGVISLQRGELAEARRQIEASLQHEPNDVAAWNNLAHVLLLQGHWTESLGCSGEAIDRDPQQAIAYNHQGNALLRLRQEAAAVESFRTALRINDRYAEAWSNLGRALMLTGAAADQSEAESCCRRAIALDPRLAAAYNHLGLVLHQQSRLDEALQAFQAATRLAPRMWEAVANSAVARAEIGDTTAARDQLLSLPVHQRDQVDIQRALGYVYQRANQPESAIRCFLRAVELRPDSVESLVNLGVALRQEGRLEEAVDVLHRAATRCPQDVTILNSLANVLRDQGQTQGARELYDVALEMEPNHALLRLNRASLCEKTGDRDAARSDLATLAGQDASPFIDSRLCQLRLATLAPGAGATVEELETHRRELLATCQSLANDEQVATWSATMLQQHAALPPLALLYQPHDNRKLREALAAVYRPAISHLAGRLHATTDATTTKTTTKTELSPISHSTSASSSGATAFHSSGQRPRVGFFVSRHHEPVFARCMSGILNQFEQDALEPVVIACSSSLTKLARHLDPAAVKVLRVPESLEQAAAVLRSAQLDVLHFWEVGTDPMNYLLPLLRTAPVQVTSWGVPNTSGITEIDAYLSSDLLESLWGVEPDPDQEANYTERLLLANTLLTYQRAASVPFTPDSWRSSLGIDDQQHLYLCSQKLEKLHPDFDHYLVDILRQDPRGMIGLFADRYATGTARLQRRLAAAAGDLAGRIRFFAHQSYADYLMTLEVADVILDTLHCSSGLTAYDAFSLAKPVVTQPGRTARSRYTMACYRKMNLPDCIVTDRQSYVALAVRIAVERDYREQLNSELRAANYVLFEDRESIFEMQRMLLSVQQ